jgi:hypothetical protein
VIAILVGYNSFVQKKWQKFLSVVGGHLKKEGKITSVAKASILSFQQGSLHSIRFLASSLHAFLRPLDWGWNPDLEPALSFRLLIMVIPLCLQALPSSTLKWILSAPPHDFSLQA